MKIIESQSAVLSNYEVYQHLIDQRDTYKKEKRRGPSNLGTVVKELLQYLQTPPSPMSQETITYTPDCIARLLERLRPYELSKGEVVMVLNLRPTSIAALNSVIEDMTDRLEEDQQLDVLAAVAEILGEFDPPAPKKTDDDVDMNDAAA